MPKQKTQKNLGKPVNTGEKLVRNVDGQFVDGHPPLPNGGRPPGVRNLTTLLREALVREAQGTGTTYDDLIIKRVIKKSIEGDMRAVELVFDRTEGKAAQAVKLRGYIATITPDKKRAAELVGRFNEMLKDELAKGDGK